jgi:hypothetical protein
MPYGQGSAGVCFATAVFVCGVAGFPTAPSTLPSAQGTITLDHVSSSTVRPGQKIHISGHGFASRAAVTVSIYSSPTVLVHATANKAGVVTAQVKIPSSLRGDHTLSAIGNGPGRTSHVLDTDVVVKKASGIGALPDTGLGAHLALWAIAGFALLLGGLIMVRGAVMRRPTMPQS